MREKAIASLVVAVAAVAVQATNALAANIFAPGDFVIAIDNNRNNPGGISNTGAEGPASAFDGVDTTKWLTFGRNWTGIIFTPAGGPTAVRSLSFTTGGDAPERDPINFQLYGTNSAITSGIDSAGTAENWTLVGTGNTGFNASNLTSTARNTTVAPVDIANTTAYTSYKILFPKLRNAGAGIADQTTLANVALPNSLQISEIRMFNALAGGGTNVSQTPSAAIPVDQYDSYGHPSERPLEAIDGQKTASSKYLNFGREGTGLIVTPQSGPSIAKSFQITTANDTEGRDPSKYEIYGTNAPIVSLEDTDGTAESWTLITSGDLALPSTRLTDGPIIGFDNNVSYTSYKIIFPDNKGPDTGAGVNSIQFAEIALFNTIPEPGSMGTVGAAAAGLILRRRRA